MGRLVLFLLLLRQAASGGFELTEVGARARALGGSYVARSDDVWAIFYNPAGLSEIIHCEGSAVYIPQQFGLSELSTSAFAFGIPSTIGTVGLAARRYGFDLYREVSTTLSYANKISGVFAGFNLNYHSVAILNYGSAGTLGVDIGALVVVSKRLTWGMAVKNINSPTIGAADEQLPSTFSFGLAYDVAGNLSLSVDYVKETRFDASLRCGFEYEATGGVFFRGGVASQPSEFSFGLGLRYDLIQIDYAVDCNPDLGLTHAWSILIRW